ncbi:MAG TPA: LysM peptidoglycan-binding domain-containing protein [Deltaproteobacteria bacterium]|nr:LysM peptidoglycan-binding domain-containing protein [Deltaproteobacteria bacterium]
MTKKTQIALLVVLLYVGIPLSYAFGLTNILNIRRWTAPDHTRVVIDVSDRVSYRTTENGKIVSIDLENTVISDTLLHEYLVDKPAVKKINLSSLPGHMTRVDLHVGDDVTVKVFSLGPIKDIKPHRVVIDVKLPAVEKMESDERKQVKIQEKRKIIVIDPGHGGEDPGAVGSRGTKEKDIVLRVAKELRNVLKKKGYQAYLTREGDYYVSFKKRLEIAREYGADLFISIHTDAHRSRGARGASVYCLSTGGATNEAARLLARSENLSDIIAGVQSGENNGEADHIMLNMLQTETINQSKHIGLKILKDLKRVNHLKYSKVHEAPFKILKLPEIPSILVEIAYISNPREEHLLRKPSYRKDVAWALASSVSDLMPLPPSLARETTDGGGVRAMASSGRDQNCSTYVVKRGDILARIAANHGTSVGALQRLNNIRQSNTIFVGQKLKVPSTEGTTVRHEDVIHVVKKGDMLEAIASRYDTTTGILMKANNLRSADRIYAGQKIKIPATEGTTVRHEDVIHVVRKGDMLEAIASRYDTTTGILMRANNLRSADRIYAGQKIKIPATEGTTVRHEDVIHVVKKGDILEKIASRYDTSTDRLMSINDLRSADKIYVGQRLNITEANGVTEDSVEGGAAPPVYVVKGGDTLAGIADRHGTTVAALMTMNDLSNGDNILKGQTLTLKKPGRDGSPNVKVGEADPAGESVHLRDKVEAVIDRTTREELKAIKDSYARQTTAAPEKRNSGDDSKTLTAESPASGDNQYAVHIVRRGDILDRIAQLYNTTTGQLMTLNNIKRKNRIYVNQRLKVPAPGGNNTSDEHDGSKTSEHIVKRGESLARIAHRYNTTIGVLLALNNLKFNDTLYVDQRLKVPAGSEEFDVYVVRRGDFLSRIAGKHGTTVTELRRLNNIQSKNYIYVGQRLRVPAS